MTADRSEPILITGGSGLIGSYLIGHLARLGYPIRALYRRQIPDVPHRDQVEWVEGDIEDLALLREVMQGVPRVFHCAGLVSYAPQDDDLLQQVNVEGTANVVNACLEAEQPVRLCHVSSIAAIGRPKGATLLDEKAKWDPAGDHSAYARSKYFGEMEVWRGMAEGLSAVIVNPSVVLGPADWNRSSTRLFKYVYDENAFYAKGYANFVDVRDVVEAMVRLMFSGLSSERFILNQGTHSYQDFFKQVAVCLQKKAPSVQAPPALTEVIWRVERLRSWLTGSRPLITKATARLAGKAFRFSSEKVKDAIQMDFRPLEETIRWTCEGLMKQQQKSEEVPQQ
jgi:dihydroflavonol-4-reductase